MAPGGRNKLSGSTAATDYPALSNLIAPFCSPTPAAVIFEVCCLHGQLHLQAVGNSFVGRFAAKNRVLPDMSRHRLG